MRARLPGLFLTMLLESTILGSTFAPAAAVASDNIGRYPQDYAAYWDIDLATAEREVELTDEAARLENALAGRFPGEFAGLWVEHDPQFRVVVALTRNEDPVVREVAGPDLWPFVVTREYTYSFTELKAAADNLEIVDVPQSMDIDVVNNKVIVSVLSASFSSAEGRSSPTPVKPRPGS